MYVTSFYIYIVKFLIWENFFIKGTCWRTWNNVITCSSTFSTNKLFITIFKITYIKFWFWFCKTQTIWQSPPLFRFLQLPITPLSVCRSFLFLIIQLTNPIVSLGKMRNINAIWHSTWSTNFPFPLLFSSKILGLVDELFFEYIYYSL